MVYNIGKWTPSTYKTLKFIYEAQSRGEKIRKLKDFPSGTMRNWFYPLKEAGYISNGDGYSLTEKGIELMKTFQENPPRDKRGIKRVIKTYPVNQKDDEKDKLCKVTIQSRELVFETLVNHDQAQQIINHIMSFKKK